MTPERPRTGLPLFPLAPKPIFLNSPPQKLAWGGHPLEMSCWPGKGRNFRQSQAGKDNSAGTAQRKPPCHHRGAHDTRVNHYGARTAHGGAHDTRGNHEGAWVEQLGLTHPEPQRGMWWTTRMRRGVGSKGRKTTPTTTSAAPVRQLLALLPLLLLLLLLLLTRKRHHQEHRPQQPSERSDQTQHAKGRADDCPRPHKETATRRNVTQGGPTPSQSPPVSGGGGGGAKVYNCRISMLRWNSAFLQNPK